eukprot:CCRYP_009865-RB/>CCRYP_009865-RB protein AED:0.49 eAED:1.00 QI:0/-1/0/1/-1/0/1/0/21
MENFCGSAVQSIPQPSCPLVH